MTQPGMAWRGSDSGATMRKAKVLWAPGQRDLFSEMSLMERMQSLTYRVAKRTLDDKRSTRNQLESALVIMEDMHDDMKG